MFHELQNLFPTKFIYFRLHMILYVFFMRHNSEGYRDENTKMFH